MNKGVKNRTKRPWPPSKLSQFMENKVRDERYMLALSDGFPLLTPSRPFDQARFTAGVVGSFRGILREPIPDNMLRLIDDIAKRERQS